MDELTTTPPKVLKLRAEHWARMVDDVTRHAPQEACGIVAGKDGAAIEVIPVANVLQSPVRYRMDPVEQLNAFTYLDEKGWDMIAIYHSHPHGPESPSGVDISEAAYQGVIHLIWFPDNDGWHCRGFLIEDREVKEVPVLLLDRIEKP